MELLKLFRFGETGWSDEMLSGALVTIAVAAAAYGLALLIGGLLAVAKISRSQSLNIFAATYTTVFRGLPELLIIYIVFFGGEAAINGIGQSIFEMETRISIPLFAAGMLCIGLSAGAYCTEVVRGAVLAVPRGQFDALNAMGLSRWDGFRDVIFPQVLRIALPGLGNIWQITLKETSLISVIGLTEIMRQADIGAGATRLPFHFYFAAAIMYMCLVLISNQFFIRVERWSGKGW